MASPLPSFPVPSSRFEHLHVDIVEPFPPSRGYTYLFTVIDRFTRWPEVIPMADCTAQTCAQAFLSGWIARFGVPASVTSDRGCQFISELWRNVLHLFGIKPTQTTSYHPQANGMVERMHRQLKASLKARLTTAAWSHPQANGMVERMHRLRLKASKQGSQLQLGPIHKLTAWLSECIANLRQASKQGSQLQLGPSQSTS